MNIRQTMKSKIKNWIQKAPDRKVYIEVLTAVLTVPVMLTVLITNLNNLTAKKTTTTANVTPAASPQVIIKTIPAGNNTVAQETASKNNQQDSSPTATDCKKQIGPVDISYPTEGENVSDNPLTIIIKHDDDTYCSVVWSYRINGGPWSEYSNNSISLYNMPNGEKKLDLRIQSTVSSDQTMITRNFNYQGSTDQTATSSAN